jgi:hypothetical protein
MTGKKIQEFAAGYVEGILFACVIGPDGRDAPDADPSELSAQTVSAIEADARDFLDSVTFELIDRAIDIDPSYNYRAAGIDFAFTRNRHGAGFWDRGFGAIGRKLTDYAHPYGDALLYADTDDPKDWIYES